ncbi:MAG: AAA family ATPase [Methanobrevibacter sp.]|nr:AAA family ATPase [Methanobrevibacter sp.]
MVFEDELISYITFRQNSTDDLLKNIKDLKYMEEYYKIKKYLDDFLENDDSVKRFVVMPGLRGVGKTTILLQLYDYLLNEKNINSKNILYLSMDDIVNYFNTNLLRTVDKFLSSVHKTDKIALKKKIFLFVDESHFDKKWAISGKIIYDNTKNIFLICTGSSAIDLEVNADVARRSFNESIYPSNFKDYLLLKHDITTNNSFSEILENIIYLGEEKYINQGISLEEKIRDHVYSLDNYPNEEFMDFLKNYGFPFSSKLSEEDAYKITFSLITKVIEKDIPSIKAISTAKHPHIWRILIYLALARPGATSNHKIANYLSISSKTVNEILDLLEKTQIIFNVKPYGGAGKLAKKPWNYYFLSSSLKSAINLKLGRYNINNKKCLGILAENYVAASLFKMQQKRFNLMGLFYPPEKGGCDFLLRTKLDDMVPVEVGIGRKTKSQLTRAINKYDSEYGVLISNRYSSIQQHNNIIHIPLLSFGFL